MTHPPGYEQGMQAVRDMGFDWYCPMRSWLPRRECPECVAKVALDAFAAAVAGEQSWEYGVRWVGHDGDVGPAYVWNADSERGARLTVAQNPRAVCVLKRTPETPAGPWLRVDEDGEK